MKDSRIETLIETISDYYDCDLTEKKRDLSHVEARGLFIVMARRELDTTCSTLSEILEMSKSNVVRTSTLFSEHIKNNKHIRRRFEEIKKVLNKVL